MRNIIKRIVKDLIFAIKFFVLIVFEFFLNVSIFFNLQKLLNFIFSSFKLIVKTFVFFVVFFIARNRDFFRNVHIYIHINHVFIFRRC
jgi:hypothetical protein